MKALFIHRLIYSGGKLYDSHTGVTTSNLRLHDALSGQTVREVGGGGGGESES